MARLHHDDSRQRRQSPVLQDDAGISQIARRADQAALTVLILPFLHHTVPRRVRPNYQLANIASREGLRVL